MLPILLVWSGFLRSLWRRMQHRLVRDILRTGRLGWMLAMRLELLRQWLQPVRHRMFPLQHDRLCTVRLGRLHARFDHERSSRKLLEPE